VFENMGSPDNGFSPFFVGGHDRVELLPWAEEIRGYGVRKEFFLLRLRRFGVGNAEKMPTPVEVTNEAVIVDVPVLVFPD